MAAIPGLAITLRDSDGTGIAFKGDFPDDMTITTAWPGGCASCRFVVKRPVKLDWPDLQAMTDVRISDGQGYFWRGRLERFRPVFDVRDEYIEIEALQVNADDQTLDATGDGAQTFAAGTSPETNIGTVRTSYLPKVTAQSLATTGRTLTADLTLTDVRAHEALTRFCEFGDSNNNPVGWGVWPDGDSSGAYQLVTRVRPTTPDYRVDIAHLQATFGWDGSKYANRQRIRFNAGAGSRYVEDTTQQGALPGGVNLVREAPLITRNDVTNNTDADNIANTALTLRKQRRVTAENATISHPMAMVTVSGVTVLTVPLWRVRAGQMLAVDGILPSGLAGTYTLDRNLLWIVQTTYSVRSRVLSLTFEDFATTLEGVIGRLYRVAQT